MDHLASMFIGVTPGPKDRIKLEAREGIGSKPMVDLLILQAIASNLGDRDSLRSLHLTLTREQLQEIVHQGQDALAQYDALVPIIAAKREVEAGGEKLVKS